MDPPRSDPTTTATSFENSALQMSPLITFMRKMKQLQAPVKFPDIRLNEKIPQHEELFFFFYEWEHRMGTMCPFSSLHPSRNGKERQ